MSLPPVPATDATGARSQPIVEVSAALLFHEGRLLITQRPAGEHLGGLWEFPGGKREPGESHAQCLVREIQEELGLDLAVGELFAEITHAYPEKTVRLRFFKCRWLRGQPQPLGCLAWRWVDRAGLAGFEFPAADARLLAALTQPDCSWE